MKKLLLISIILFASVSLYSRNYYINSKNYAGSGFCTAAGNNTFSGTNKAQPKASITNLLHTYIPQPGEIIYIDYGIYNEQVKLNNISGNNVSLVTFKGTNSNGTNSLITGNGALANNGCISISNSSYIKMDSLYIKYSGGNFVVGIKITNSSHLLIVNNTIISNSANGLHILGTSGTNIIQNNFIAYNNADAIFFETQINNSVISNRIYHNNGEGIKIDIIAFPMVLIIGNEINNNAGGGISLFRSHNTIVGNKIHNNANQGILCDFGGQLNIITGNLVYSNGGIGIALNNSTSLSYTNMLIGNQIYNNNSAGLQINSFGNNVRGNQIYNNSTDGLQIFSSGNYFTTNFIHNNSQAGIYTVSPGGNNVIINNQIYSNHTDGIGGQVLNDLILSNSLHYNMKTGVSLWNSSSSNSIFKGNKIRKNNTQGLYLNCYSISFSGNVIFSNGGNGILLNTR